MAHLDKSHICVHTYPESHPEGGLCTFRADIESLDLRRDFTAERAELYYPPAGIGHRHHDTACVVLPRYQRHEATSSTHEIQLIQNFMSEDMKSLYDMMDVNVYQENFPYQDVIKEFDLKHYMFHTKPEDLSEEERKAITDLLWKEMREIYYGRNIRPCKSKPEQGCSGLLFLFHKVAVGIYHLKEILYAAHRQALFVVVAHPLFHLVT